MLNKNLTEIWDAGKFAPSWIIASNNLDATFECLTYFAKQIMNCGDLPIENNPDFMILRRELNSTGDLSKHITIDQIRNLQKFLSVTHSIAEHKIVIVHEADLMNINAANCCLKILEETPKNSFIFLVTSNPNNILATIRSRCAVLYTKCREATTEPNSYLSFLTYLYDNQVYIDKLSSKIDKTMLQDYAQSALYFLSRIIKNYNLTHNEETAKKILLNVGTGSLMYKYDKVKKTINDVKEFDPDSKANFILMMENIKN